MIQCYQINPSCFKLKKIALSLAFALTQSISTQASPEQTSEVLKLSNNKRIEAPICADSMNRIAVSNDRITQIFGDEGTFESQNDEATGQVFLKPTTENGAKSLSITLITEQGVTQDLTLKPIAKSAKTLILGRDNLGNDPDRQASLHRDFLQPTPEPQLDLGKALPIQEQLLTLLKQAISGQLPVAEEEGIFRQLSSLEGYSLTPDQSWQVGPYGVHAYHLENVSETPLELQEKDFYQLGDLALSFDTRVLKNRIFQPHQKITLYVVCHRKADLS